MVTDPHDTCSQHPITCRELTDNAKGIDELKKEHVIMRSSLEKAITTKTALGVVAMLMTAFLGLFYFSVNMNMSAIEDITKQEREKASMISRLFKLQSETKNQLIKIETNVDTLTATMNEVKGDVKEMQRQSR